MTIEKRLEKLMVQRQGCVWHVQGRRRWPTKLEWNERGGEITDEVREVTGPDSAGLLRPS